MCVCTTRFIHDIHESSTWRTHSTIVLVVISVYHRFLSLSVVRLNILCATFFFSSDCVYFFFLSILFILFAIVLTPFLRLLITIYHNCFSVSFICCYEVICFLWVKIEFTVCVCVCVYVDSFVRPFARYMFCGICRAFVSGACVYKSMYVVRS